MKQLKLPAQLTQILNRFTALAKHHYFISVVVLLASLSFAVFVVNETLSKTEDEEYYQQKLSESLKATFDKDTIEKIQKLQKSTEHSAIPPELPAGARTNPFSE